jgi:hypothetical protein
MNAVGVNNRLDDLDERVSDLETAGAAGGTLLKLDDSTVALTVFQGGYDVSVQGLQHVHVADRDITSTTSYQVLCPKDFKDGVFVLDTGKLDYTKTRDFDVITTRELFVRDFATFAKNGASTGISGDRVVVDNAGAIRLLDTSALGSLGSDQVISCKDLGTGFTLTDTGKINATGTLPTDPTFNTVKGKTGAQTAEMQLTTTATGWEIGYNSATTGSHVTILAFSGGSTTTLNIVPSAVRICGKSSQAGLITTQLGRRGMTHIGPRPNKSNLRFKLPSTALRPHH